MNKSDCRDVLNVAEVLSDFLVQRSSLHCIQNEFISCLQCLTWFLLYLQDAHAPQCIKTVHAYWEEPVIPYIIPKVVRKKDSGN